MAMPGTTTWNLLLLKKNLTAWGYGIKDGYCLHYSCSCCISLMASIPNGCGECFPTWGSTIRNLHVSASSTPRSLY